MDDLERLEAGNPDADNSGWSYRSRGDAPLAENISGAENNNRSSENMEQPIQLDDGH